MGDACVHGGSTPMSTGMVTPVTTTLLTLRAPPRCATFASCAIHIVHRRPDMARISPDSISPEQARLAALRVWAAQVRDRQAPHASIAPELAELAGALAKVLDLAEEAQRTGAASNLAPALHQTADLL